MELKAKDWVNLLSADRPPAAERVILVSRLRKRTALYIAKAQWSQGFRHFRGIAFRKGREIQLIPKDTGGNRTQLPQWVLEQLVVASGDSLGITQRRKKYFIKKLELEETPGEIPGHTVIDSFHNTRVRRTCSILTDVEKITYSGLRQLLSEMGRFRYDPVSPFKGFEGRIGFLARKEFLGGFTKKDKAAIRAHNQGIVSTQEANGSWANNVVRTAFNLIRLTELGATLRTRAVDEAARWLLATQEPVGLPGLFMFSQELLCRFNEWKEKPGAHGRQYRKHLLSEMQEFLDNSDVLPNLSNTLCELRVTWASAVAIEALLRCGLENEDRVIRAVNTLLALRKRGRWCGCGYLDAKVDIPRTRTPVDFSRRFPLPRTNAEIYGLDWFATAKDDLKLVCNGNYKALDVGRRKALLVKQFRTTGDCSLVVHRALSYHSRYRGSNLEKIAALESTYRQNSYGTWGDAYLSCMFDYLGRFRHPLSAFLILRSVPLLIRRQRPDGLWPEESKRSRVRFLKKPVPPRPEVATYMILKALKRFDFLDALRPR